MRDVDSSTTIPIESYNKLLIHPQFEQTITDIYKLNIKLPKFSSNEFWDTTESDFPSFLSSELLILEDLKAIKLDAERGQDFLHKGPSLSAYDESIQKFNALEGTAYITSHSLVLLGQTDYVPLNFITFYFYTRADEYTKKSILIKKSDNAEVDSKKDYISDRTTFLVENTPENSLLFIDGPLMGGQVIDQTVDMNIQLENRNILPIFIVKNSGSNMVTQKIKDLRGKFNSDLHWCHKFIPQGMRTNFFEFRDPTNKRHSKVFCYMKAYAGSPQRIEIYPNFYKRFEKKIDQIMDLVYYLLVLQGNKNDPQLRLISVAEKFARSTLKLFNLKKLMKEVGITATMNQERFG